MASHVLSVYGQGLALRLKAYTQYRIDTWLRLITRLVRFAVQLVFVGVTFSFVDTLAKWSLWHVVLMWAVGMSGRYLMEGLLFFALLSKDLFFYGTLDYYCVRPMPIFACASAHNLQIEECLNALVFIAVGGAACAHLGLLDKPITLFFLFIGMLASLLVWLGIALFVSCAAVWFGQTSAIWQGLSAMYEHAKYPLDILPLPLQILLTVVPLGFTAYYPVRYALQAQEHVWLGLIAPTVGIAVAGLAYAVYRKAVHQYESTGGVDPSA